MRKVLVDTDERSEIQIRMNGSPPSRRHALDQVVATATTRGFSSNRISEVTTAVDEALNNAWRHGNRGQAGLPILLRIRTEGPSMIIEVEDGGSELGPAPLPDLGAKLEGKDRPRGWGLYLIRQLASEVRWWKRPEGGKTLSMQFLPGTPDHLTDILQDRVGTDEP